MQSSKQSEQKGICALFGLKAYFLPDDRILSASELLHVSIKHIILVSANSY